MSEPRLRAKIWVSALLRACSAQGAMATVARRGDEDAGAVLIKQNLLDRRFVVLSQIRATDGSQAWLRATGETPVDETTADAYVARQVERDWDLWVIEIEDREGRLPFAAEIL